jgi:hypothetical protein
MTGNIMSTNINLTIQDYIDKYYEFKNIGSKYPTTDVYEFYNLPKGGRKAPSFSYGDERCRGFSRIKAIPGL